MFSAWNPLRLRDGARLDAAFAAAETSGRLRVDGDGALQVIGTAMASGDRVRRYAHATM